MADITRSAATLCLMGEDLLPEEVTRLLGHAPSRSYSRGQLRLTNAAGEEFFHQHGAWMLIAQESESTDLNTQVAALLGKLAQELAVWKALGEPYRINLFCGLFMAQANEGAGLSSANLLALGERGIALDLDIYAPIFDELSGLPPRPAGG